MTKLQLIKMLENFPDHADICVFFVCPECNSSVLDGAVDICQNGPGIQLNTESACEAMEKEESKQKITDDKMKN